MTVELTEQQNHLSNLLDQRNQIVEKVSALQKDIDSAREYYFRVQGAIEYLQQTGVSLPEPEPNEEVETREAVPVE